MCYKWNCSLFLSGTLPRLVSVKITCKFYSSVYSMTTFISVMDMKEFIHFQYQILKSSRSVVTMLTQFQDRSLLETRYMPGTMAQDRSGCQDSWWRVKVQ